MKYILLLILLTNWGSKAFTQVIQDISDDKKFALKIKNFDEFIERFNYDDSMFIAKVGLLEKENTQRKHFIKTLIHRDLFLENTLIDSLTTCITNKDITINTTKGNVYAIGTFQSKISNKIYFQTLIFQLKRQGKGYKWVITSINEEFLKYIPEKKISNNAYIPPSNNDVNFNQLENLIDQGFIDELFDYNIVNSKPHLFIELLKNKQIAIQNCIRIAYYIFIDNLFLIEVSYVESQDSFQTGWLITDILLSQNQDIEKTIYRLVDENK